ncbi:MAG: hypothetical protein QOJ19_2046 [Acidimicrobiia bacterium]|nr:hypothetical protein [Acidimicrobiia bacterium]
MPKYAADTSVPVENSRAELERILTRYGATSFAFGWDATKAVVEFTGSESRVRFVLPLPDRDDEEFTMHSRGRRTPEAAHKVWEQAYRQRWRTYETDSRTHQLPT